MEAGSQTNIMFITLLSCRYGQEVPGERLEILQQPLALGYLASTAATGPMPRCCLGSFLRQNAKVSYNFVSGGSGQPPPTWSPCARCSSSPPCTSTLPTLPMVGMMVLVPGLVRVDILWTATSPQMCSGRKS